MRLPRPPRGAPTLSAASPRVLISTERAPPSKHRRRPPARTTSPSATSPPAPAPRPRCAPAALAEAGAGAGETALCRALAEKRAGAAGLAGLDDRARSKLARFLLGRGFSGSAVARVLGLYDDG